MKIKLKILKKYHKLKVYGEKLKILDGRQAKKYRKEHSAELFEYGEIRKQVLEFYLLRHIPKIICQQKNAGVHANAQQTIEKYFRQEQIQDHQKKKKNDLE